jgi:Relaxase/Mobilisation nuclease domain
VIFKLHPKSASFKLVVRRLLSEECGVAGTEMVNLCTHNPEVAWWLMRATAMSAGYIKQKAGVKWTGRQSDKAVLHLAIYWPHDEWPDPPEMLAVAHRALAALKAQDRQALIICHEGHSHPHLHVIINRVSPLDGRMLSSAQEELALLKLFRLYEAKRAQRAKDQTEAGGREEEASWREPA